MVGKPRIYGGTSPEKLQFTENDGYGRIGLRTLKMVELAGQLARDDWKMAKTIVAPQTHSSPTGRVFHRPVTKLQACDHRQLLSLLVRRVCGEAAWSTSKMVVPVDGDNAEMRERTFEKEREKKTCIIYMHSHFFFSLSDCN